ncbi:MAG: hypothetical protein M3Z04_01060, partial [Chloroflexota bacterium]|nr:hypothetical protein [Chloroflexota bacterium]
SRGHGGPESAQLNQPATVDLWSVLAPARVGGLRSGSGEFQSPVLISLRRTRAARPGLHLFARSRTPFDPCGCARPVHLL